MKSIGCLGACMYFFFQIGVFMGHFNIVRLLSENLDRGGTQRITRKMGDVYAFIRDRE